MKYTLSMVFFIAFGNFNYAAVYTSATSGNWSNPNSWLPIGVPTMNDTAIINDATIVVDVNTMVKCMTLENTGRIRTNNK